MSNNKMKGLLKGLRYISNIFENEKYEPEMKIGVPTDVKHVAHIGWEGPSVNSPSWMNEFKTPELGRGDIMHEASSIKSEDSSSKKSGRDPELPKSTRRHSSTEEPTRERSEKSSSSRRSKHMNKDSSESAKSKKSSEVGDVPKKSRRKKSRDSADGSSRSSRTSRKGQSSKSDAGSECGSVSNSNDNDNDNNNQEGSQISCVNPSEGGQEKEHTGVS